LSACTSRKIKHNCVNVASSKKIVSTYKLNPINNALCYLTIPNQNYFGNYFI
jgi:hypothetical protein